MTEIDLEKEAKELADMVAAMRALDCSTYFNQDILKRLEQVGMVLELENTDPLIWSDEGVGITLWDVIHDAMFEIKRLRKGL